VGAIEEDILLDKSNPGGGHEVTCEIIVTWLGSAQIPCRELGRICLYKSTIIAEWLQEGTNETTMICLRIDVNQGVHLVGSEGYASAT
jgi:hypothetical protein